MAWYGSTLTYTPFKSEKWSRSSSDDVAPPDSNIPTNATGFELKAQLKSSHMEK